MRWRLGASVLTVITAAIAIWAAVLGPLYLYTAGDSVLRRTVASSNVQNTGVTVYTYSNQGDEIDAVKQGEGIVQRTGGPAPLYGSPITTVTSGVVLANGDKSQLFWRTGICHVLHFVRGGCQLGPGEVVMTTRGAQQLGASVGATVAAHVAGSSQPLHLRVSGIASVPDLNLPYWWGDGVQDFPIGYSSSVLGHAETDPLIASAATALTVPPQDVPTVTGQLPLRTGAVGLGNEGAVKQGVSQLVNSLDQHGVRASTQLLTVLAGTDQQRHTMTTIVAVAAIQLVLLAVWVLSALLIRGSETRRSEARVARLRGFPAAGMLWVTAAEPALLCAFGGILGVAAAWGSMVLARNQLFAPSAVIAFDGWTFAALAVAVVAIAGALVLATARLWRSANRPDTSARAISGGAAWSRLADVILIVLAIAALVELATAGALNGHVDPLASAAPGLIALGVAVLAVQLLLLLCRFGISLTDSTGWVGSFLALRQSVRRPRVLRQARVLIIALCLACFAASAWSVARSNRSAAAEFQVGARTVVNVAPESAVGLQKAVRRVDPGGRFAMAAIDLRTPSTTLLAVDSSRLAATTSWPSGISSRGLQSIARSLARARVPAVQLPSGTLDVSARTNLITTGTAVDLGAWVFGNGTAVVDLGRLRRGESTYRSDLAAVCPDGCELVGFGVVPAPGEPAPAKGGVQLSIGHLSTRTTGEAARPASADLVPHGWLSTVAGVNVTSGKGGLDISATAAAIATATGSSPPPMVTPADHPSILPVVATSELESINNGAVGPTPTQGLDGNTISVRPVATASALPRLGSDALMVDLNLISNIQVGPTSPDATDEVWLGPQAPADALARLQAAGLRPTSVERSSTLFEQLQRTGPALADDFLLLATIAALLVAAASTLGSLGATTRDRATELASLEISGVPRAALVRSLGLESGILILTALCGAGAGVLAAAMAIPSMPELSSTSFAPVNYGLPGGVIAGVTALVIAAVALAVGAVSIATLRRMSPVLLRTVPDDLAV